MLRFVGVFCKRGPLGYKVIVRGPNGDSIKLHLAKLRSDLGIDGGLSKL